MCQIFFSIIIFIATFFFAPYYVFLTPYGVDDNMFIFAIVGFLSLVCFIINQCSDDETQFV